MRNSDLQIPEFTPRLDRADLRAVLETLRGNWITEGSRTRELEQRLAEFFGCKRVIMMPNGTLSLFAALKVLGIGPGDEVLVPDFTFFGSASAVVLTGAKPVFVDVTPTGNICAVSAGRSISERTRAIMPVHLYGRSADMDAILALARTHRLVVVEDAAQGIGVTFHNRHVGTLGDIGCISFFADKTMTTGEGGALMLDDDDLIERCLYFKNQGRLNRGSFIHPKMGYNFRITDIQAAIGLMQLHRIETTIAQKRALEAVYYRRLRGVPGVRFPAADDFGEVVPFRVNILVDDPAGLSEFLHQNRIGTRRFFYPLHMQPSFDASNSVVRHRPVQSVRLFEAGLMLPSGLDLTEEQIERVCGCIEAFQRRATARQILKQQSRSAADVVPVTSVLPSADTSPHAGSADPTQPATQTPAGTVD